MKLLKKAYITAAAYRWLWFLLFSRIPLTRDGLGKAWAWLTGVLQQYLSSFGPEAYAKVSAVAGAVWKFLLIPSLLIFLLSAIVKTVRKHWKKPGKGDFHIPIKRPDLDAHGTKAPSAPPETYFFVRFLYMDDAERYHERSCEVTRLMDQPAELAFRDCHFKLSFGGFRRKVPVIELEAVTDAGAPVLETESVILPANGACQHNDWSFELLSASI